MPKISAVLFDLDGTLRDTRDAIYDALQHTIKVHTDREVERDELKPHIHHHTVVHQAFASHVSSDQFEDTYTAVIDPAVSQSLLYPGGQEIIDYLHQEGYALAIVTSAWQEKTEDYLRAVGVDQMFQTVAGMTPDVQPKPAPDLVELALKKLGCSPDTAVMVGDMIVDVEAAHEAGVKCIGITHGFASAQELKAAGADHIINALTELPEAIKSLSK